jgi:hypothetical protein
MALSGMFAPSFQRLRKWSKRASKRVPLLSAMYNQITRNERIPLKIIKPVSSYAEIQMAKIDKLYESRLLDLDSTPIRRLWCDFSTTSYLGSGGFKTVLGVEILNEAYALVLPNSMYKSIDSNISIESLIKSTTSSDDDFSSECTDELKSMRSILRELELMHDLRNTNYTVQLAFKFRGLPMYALELCALQSLKSFVRSSSSGVNWHSQIVPNLPFALELIHGNVSFFLSVSLSLSLVYISHWRSRI